MSKRSEKPPKDHRAEALSNVWGWALLMLAVSIPLCTILKTALIPMIVIFAAVVVTFYVWNSGKGDTVENEALRAKIKELEERLANVEVINRFEDRLAEKKARQQAAATEPAHAAAPESPTPPRTMA
jgi:uncharacterized protein (DUF58 family)